MSAVQISNKNYHRHEAIGSTFVKLICEKSLLHAVTEVKKKKVTDAMKLGSAVHCLTLNPEDFENEFCLELRKEDFDNVVDTIEEMKDRLRELTAGSMERAELELQSLGRDKTRLDEQKKQDLLKLKQELESRIDNVDPSRFQAKKYYNARIRDIKASNTRHVSEIRTLHKARVAAIAENKKAIQKRIKILKDYQKGNKKNLVENLKKLDPQVIIWPELVRTYLEDNKDKEVISSDLYDKAIAMRKALLSDKRVIKLISGGSYELAYFSEDPNTGLPRKCKPDVKKKKTIIDLKTTRDASDYAFMRECLRRKYHVQGGYYVDVHNGAHKNEEDWVEDVIFIAVENTEPFAVNVLRLRERELALGKKEYKEALFKYATFLETLDAKPETSLSDYGYGREVGTITFPESAFIKEKNDE